MQKGRNSTRMAGFMKNENKNTNQFQSPIEHITNCLDLAYLFSNEEKCVACCAVLKDDNTPKGTDKKARTIIVLVYFQNAHQNCSTYMTSRTHKKKMYS